MEAIAVHLGLCDAFEEIACAFGLDSEGRLAIIEPSNQIGMNRGGIG